MKRPQISVRMLLAVVFAIAIAMGWVADRKRLQARLAEAAAHDLQANRQFDYVAHLAADREIEIAYLEHVAKKSAR